jgi:hypothetical protein
MVASRARYRSSSSPEAGIKTRGEEARHWTLGDTGSSPVRCTERVVAKLTTERR